MLQYSNGRSPATPVRTIRGRTLAHQQWRAPRRALIAADLIRGDLELVDLTIRQAADLCHVSGPYVHAALKIEDATVRRRIEAGARPLVLPRPRVTAFLPSPDSLVNAWTHASPAERIAFANAVGPREIWDQALEPAIA
jgi:hypothetical protein